MAPPADIKDTERDATDPAAANMPGGPTTASKDALGKKLWSASQDHGMDTDMAKKVVGIVINQFTAAQIAAWFDAGNVPDVLDSVAAKVNEAVKSNAGTAPATRAASAGQPGGEGSG